MKMGYKDPLATPNKDFNVTVVEESQMSRTKNRHLLSIKMTPAR